MKSFESNQSALKAFALEILNKLQGKETPVFLCVGSDKFVCDSLGPMVGEMLTKKYNVGAYVYGGLEYNINADNLSQAIAYIETEHPVSPIILVDATLDECVGRVLVGDGGYAGLGKILPIKKCGDISILGVVGSRTKKFNLNSTKLKIVCEMSTFIAKGLAMAMSVYNRNKKSRQNALKSII